MPAINKKEAETQIPVVVDQNGATKYETHNWAMKILRIPPMLILNILPTSLARSVLLAFSNPNSDNRIVFHSVTTYKALEVMYTFPARRAKRETNMVDLFWEYFLNNARAIRNRLLLAKKEILKAIKEVSQRKDTVNLLSLGSGSARAVFEVMGALNGQPSVRCKLIDMSRRAISFSQELACGYNVNHQAEWHRDYAHNLKNYCQDFQPDIVEMVGLLDYYPEEQAVDLVTKIYDVLSPSGWLITCNIRPNFESPFVTKGINWPLIYRSPEELVSIICQAGFSPKFVQVVYEPLKVHGLAIAQKVV